MILPLASAWAQGALGDSGMSAEEFVTCMEQQGVQISQDLADLAKQVYDGYAALPAWAQAALAATAEYGGTALAEALAALGVAAGEAIAAVIVGVGIGAFMGAVYNCYSTF